MNRRVDSPSAPEAAAGAGSVRADALLLAAQGPGSAEALSVLADVLCELHLCLLDASANEVHQPLGADDIAGLAAALADLPPNVYAVIDGGPGRQVYTALYGGNGCVRCEVVADAHLPISLRIGARGWALLRDNGWYSPAETGHNFWCTAPITSAAQRIAAAHHVLHTMREVYGLHGEARYRLRVGG